jgi:hypothetical protein
MVYKGVRKCGRVIKKNRVKWARRKGEWWVYSMRVWSRRRGRRKDDDDEREWWRGKK